MPQKEYIKWFKDTDRHDLPLVGGKSANLGEMTQAGFPVPSGFSVTSTAYYEFIEFNKLNEKIKEILTDLDFEDSADLQKRTAKIRKLIQEAKIPPTIAKEVINAYKKMSRNKRQLVAVRSSATAEDLPDASFAGQQETFLNVSGHNKVLEAVRKCWSSLFTARSTYYREQKNFDHFKVAVAVPVQKMVQSDTSGVMFTVNPITNDHNNITIEAVFGLGEGIVSGAITPDHYEVNKKTGEISKKQIVKQTKMIARKGEAPVSSAWQKKQKIDDKIIKELAQYGIKLEKHYKFPQDIEWAVEDNKIYIVQTRPITTIPQDKISQDEDIPQSIDLSEANLDVLLEGFGASPGVVSGKVVKLKGPNEISKVKTGEILVATMTTPDYVPAMKKASAIITNEGGSTCHAAIVSRELGIPCVVGTEIATQILANGEEVTVDGKSGKIYPGDLTSQVKEQKEIKDLKLKDSQTATKIYVNLGNPERAPEIARMNVDGVGLLRAEFMIAEIGTHPEYLISKNKEEEFIDKLYEGLMTFARNFNPRPIIYRATDFKTNEYRNLKGGEKYEPQEANPMMGVRGALRYILKPHVFELEIEAIKRVRRYYKNLWMMVPFVRTPEELQEVKKIMSGHELHRTPSFKLFMMVEIPSNVILLEKFIGQGIDGVSIGSNDLTQLILGADRDNPKLGNTFNEMDPAVMWAIEKTVITCRQHGIMCSICGQAPSVYPEFASKLVRWGVTSISVNPDVIDQVRHTVAKMEESMVEKRLDSKKL